VTESTLSKLQVDVPKHQDRMKVALLSLPPRTQAVLEFFFSSTGRASFAAVDDSAADFAIFDQDTLESRQHWARFVAAYARPGIALAVQQQDIPDTIWVQKPVTPAALMGAAAQLRQMAMKVALAPVSTAAIEVVAAPEPLVLPVVAEAPVVAAPVVKAAVEEAALEVTAVQGPASVVARSASPVAAPDRSSPPAAAKSAVASGGAAAVAAPRAGLVGGLLRKLFGGRAAAAPSPVVADKMLPQAASWAPAPLASNEPVAAAELADAAGEVALTVPEVLVAAEAPAVQPQPEDQPAPLPEPAPETAPAEAAAEEADEAQQAYRLVASDIELVDEAELCGRRDDLSAVALASQPELRYELTTSLVSALTEAYLVGLKWQVPTQIDTAAGAVVVDTTQNLAFLDFDRARLSALLGQPMDKRPKTRAVSRQEFAELSQRPPGQVTVVRLDALLWRAGMETAQGRLPEGVSPARTVYLKHWPNLTRLHNTPHALRIAALWATRGGTLLDTAATLRVAQRHVFAFYNAALALDLITEDGSHIRRAQRKATRNRGLLTKLFSWLQK
jgi:hypothetical protein